MTDLILSGIAPSLVARVQRLADTRGWSMQEALVFLLDRGLARSGTREAVDIGVLEEALIALKNLPNDSGFALIGRVAAPPVAPDPTDPLAFVEAPPS